MELFKIFGTLGLNGVDRTNRELDDVTGKAENSSSAMTSAFKKIGAAVAAAFAIDRIIAFGREITNAAATVSAETSAFEQIMSNYSDTAKQKMKEVADATGMVDTRLTTYMTSMTAKFKGLGYDIDDATSMAQDGLTIAADAAAFWDKSLDESMSHLNSFINGSYEGGEAIGLFANDTQMAMYAVEQGLIKSKTEWANLDEATKQATRLEYAQNMMDLSGATGQASKEAEQYANVQANLNEKWRQFKAQIGEPLLQNLVLPMLKKLSSAIGVISDAVKIMTGNIEISDSKFAKFEPTINKIKNAFQFLKDVFEPVINTIKTNIENNIPKWKEAFEGFGDTLKTLKPIFELLGAVFSIAIGVIIGVINGFISAFSGIITIVQGVVETVAGFINWLVGLLTLDFDRMQQGAEDCTNGIIKVFSGLWDGVKGFLEGFVDGVINFFTSLWDTLVGHSIVPDTINAIVDWFGQLPSRVAEKVKELFDKVKAKFEEIETAIINVLNIIKQNTTNIWSSIKNTVTTIVNSIKATITSVFNGIKTSVSNIVNNVKSIISNAWNNIKSNTSSVFNGIRSTVTSVWNGIRSTISNAINGAKNTVQSGLNAIKGFFDRLKLNFPKIKLPHFSIKGSFSLKPPSVPKLSIAWYKNAMDNAMLLNSPTIFGMNGAGQLLGGGEAGQEVVAGSNTLMSMIRAAVKEESASNDYIPRLMTMLENYLGELVERSDKAIVLDDDTLVGKMTSKLDENMGNLNKLKVRGV